MIEAFLYRVRVRYMPHERRKFPHVQITLTPTWLGRLLWRCQRVGVSYRTRDSDGQLCWWWTATNRYVGRHIERYIEAAPTLRLDDITVAQLIGDEPIDGHEDKP